MQTPHQVDSTYIQNMKHPELHQLQAQINAGNGDGSLLPVIDQRLRILNGEAGGPDSANKASDLISVSLLSTFDGSITTCEFDTKESIVNLAFKQGQKVLVLDPLSVWVSPTSTIKKMAAFIGHDQTSTEAVAIIDASTMYQIHISTTGEYVRFTKDDKELFYWDRAELDEDTTLVLGAIAGAIMA